MRIVTFKSVEGKNFLSIGDEEVFVEFKPGVNAITGTNLDKEDSKNGAGKSTITEMLYYSLYGVTLREISKDHIQNSLTQKRCEVALTLEVSSNNTVDTYKIVRKLNPSKCSLYKNGEDVTRSTLAKTNAFIQELIRTPATVFQNSVIMTANNSVPFMALPKTDRRKFIESVLGLELFTTMLLKVREEHSSTKREYEITYTKLEHTQAELKFNQSQLENYEATKKERTDKLLDKKSKLSSDIQTLNDRLSGASAVNSDDWASLEKSLIDERTALNEKLNSVKEKRHKILAEIAGEQKQIKRLQTDKDTCPTCKRNYSEEHVAHIQASIADHNKTIEIYTQAQSKVDEVITDLNIKISSVSQHIQSLTEKKAAAATLAAQHATTRNSLSHLLSNLKEVDDEIAHVQTEHNNELKGKLTSLSSSAEELSTQVSKLNNDLNVLESVKFVLSEEGIKSFLVKKILKVLNSRLAFYLKKLEANCLCKFNEFFDEEIVDEKTQAKSYFNFSGGERKRIDLACLFAFADVRRLQGDVNFSTVFYDELLDSSLDDKGVVLTLRSLRERFQENNESCYIITHRGPQVTTKAEHTIHVTKRNGVTTVSA